MDVKKLTELSIDIICTIDHEGHIGYVNPAFTRALGYLKEKLEDKNLFDFIHPDDVEETVAHVRSLVVNKDCIKFENRILCKDQSIKYFSWNACSIKDENVIYAIGNDITERKSILANVSQSSHVLGLSQSIAKVGGWELDLITNELFWTAETYRIHDANAESFDPSADAGLDYYLPESRARLSEALQMARENGEAYDLELQLKTALGRIIDVRTTCKVTVKEGQSIKLTGAFQDITDRKNAEKKLIKAKQKAEESKRYFASIINHIGAPLFVKDDQSRLRLVNDSFCDLFGLTQEDIIGKTLTENVSSEEREHFLKVDNEVIATGQDSIIEESLTLSEIKPKTILTRKTRFFDEEGNKFLVGTISDITDRKISEDNIKESEAWISSILNSLTSSVCVIDKTGRVLQVNETWRKLGQQGGNKLIPSLDAEFNYFDVCSADPHDKEASSVAQGLHGLLNGKVESFDYAYPCHAPDNNQWFLLRANLMQTKERQIVISHTDITERKLLEEDQRRLSQQSQLAIKTAKLGVWVHDITSGYLEWNDQLLEIYGITRNEFQANLEGWRLQLHPEDADYTNNQLAQIFHGKSIFGLEFRVIRKDGEIRYIDASGAPVFNEDNKVIQVIGINQDITDRKRAQEEIKNSEEKFSKAFENAPYPISILNINTGEQIAVNNAFIQAFGYTEKELLKGNVHFVNLNENTKEAASAFSILKNGGGLEKFPFAMKTKTGDIRKVLLNATKLYPNNDNIFITSFTDITVQEEKERALKQSDRVFNAAIDMFCIAGFDGYFQYLNPEWERTLGWTKEELTSKPWIEFIHPEDKVMTENIKSIIIDGKEIYRFENRYICKNGSIKWLSWNLKPYVDEGIIIGVARDITESKKVEIQLINAKKRAEESDRLKSSFLSNMSHEIRTPKNDDLSTEERNRYLNIIDRNSKQLLDLIDDIIDAAKMESDQLKITIKECQVGQIISDLEMIFNEIKLVESKPNIEFRANVPDKFRNMVILTDCLRLRQVLTNLLGNALKYSEKGIISFGVDVIKDEVVFYVKDEGIGISEENISPIFERFKQLDKKDNEGFSAAGAGLGLAICKGIVELLGGTISVKSELNVGSEFTFRIPFNKGKTRKTDQAKRKETSISLEGKTILIAEDGATARLYFKVALKETKANILFANNGKVAIELFMAHPEIDVVMMDIGMPIMNGFQAMEQILKLDPSAKIIAQTAYAMTNEKEKCFAIGCKDYLTKPIQKEALIQVLGRWVE
jgi:PAS domain S-box-containing protein